MTIDQFWNERCDLIYIYEKQYVNRIHDEAYIYGAYVDIAISTAVANMFKKGGEVIAYPSESILNPFNKNNMSKKTTYLKSLDTSKSNKELYQIKTMMEERRKK